MRNLLLTIAYDGAAYHGWQVQENARTVQQAFQEAAGRVLGVCPSLKGCSRTDTGVHARQFCLSMKTEHAIPCGRLVDALNHFLPADIAVLSCREVPEEFHARYSCRGKEYEYCIWNARVRSPFLRARAYHYYYPLQVEAMNEAAGHFLGSHDFSAFCRADSRERENMVRTITASTWRREGDMVIYRVAADGFLYNMVRILVGTMLYVSQGKIRAEEIPAILQSGDRSKAGPTAPAQGLYLNRVFYDGIEPAETIESMEVQKA